MSLVVWDGEVLAADTGMWYSDLRDTMSKLAASADPMRVAATVGRVHPGERFRAAFIAGQLLPKDFDFADCSAITINRTPDGVNEVMVYEGSLVGTPWPARRPYYIGNGAAVSAAVALVEIAGMSAHEALSGLLRTQRHDAVWGSVEYWTKGELYREQQ